MVWKFEADFVRCDTSNKTWRSISKLAATEDSVKSPLSKSSPFVGSTQVSGVLLDVICHAERVWTSWWTYFFLFRLSTKICFNNKKRAQYKKSVTKLIPCAKLRIYVTSMCFTLCKKHLYFSGIMFKVKICKILQNCAPNGCMEYGIYQSAC